MCSRLNSTEKMEVLVVVVDYARFCYRLLFVGRLSVINRSSTFHSLFIID